MKPHSGNTYCREVEENTTSKVKIPTQPLGQAGFRLQFDDTVVYIDPYLSDSVAELDGEDLQRLVPIPILPENVTDATWVLISHIHLDHCDPQTLIPLSCSSSECKFICPQEVGILLSELGISKSRIVAAPEEWMVLSSDLRLRAVPSAHPAIERDASGCLRCVGYVLEYQNRLIYHAGDTSPAVELIDALKNLGSIEVALLPVNEKNFYRDRRGIIGNMSVREAFQMAIDIDAATIVPMHWDMFQPNSVFLEEIELLYRLIAPPIKMLIRPEEI